MKNNKLLFLLLLSIIFIYNNNVNANEDYLKCNPDFCLKEICGPKQTTCMKNSCCKGCKDDCSLVKCKIVCKEDEIPIQNNCDCCPTSCSTKINPCASVECPLIKCAKGYTSKKVGCCNECVKD